MFLDFMSLNSRIVYIYISIIPVGVPSLVTNSINYLIKHNLLYVLKLKIDKFVFKMNSVCDVHAQRCCLESKGKLTQEGCHQMLQKEWRNFISTTEMQ